MSRLLAPDGSLAQDHLSSMYRKEMSYQTSAAICVEDDRYVSHRTSERHALTPPCDEQISDDCTTHMSAPVARRCATADGERERERETITVSAQTANPLIICCRYWYYLLSQTTPHLSLRTYCITMVPTVAAISEVFWGLLGPFQFMYLSLKSLPPTTTRLVSERDFVTLFLSPRALQDAWFGTFWAQTGPEVKKNASARVLPLLDGRVVAGRLLPEPAVPGLEGVCIEIGAGAGYWVDIFADKHMHTADNGASGMGRTKSVTRVYGVEPNPNQHASLRRHIAEAGLEGVYEIVPVGIEDLGGGTPGSKKWDGRIEKESVDCIVTVLCLCSIPEPQRHIRELYGYLKKGGRWYFYEHVQCDVSWYMKLYQRKSAHPISLPPVLARLAATCLWPKGRVTVAAAAAVTVVAEGRLSFYVDLCVCVPANLGTRARLHQPLLASVLGRLSALPPDRRVPARGGRVAKRRHCKAVGLAVAQCIASCYWRPDQIA